MLQQIKATFIVFVPKSDNATTPDKFRPIALTNEIYKIIACILDFRLKPVISKVVGPMQSAFIPGREILDNILLIQDLLHNFHLKRGSPKMCLKLDLAKAYDSVRWELLEAAMGVLGFPAHFIRLVMECVKYPSYSILLNESAVGYIKGTWGL